MDIDDRLIASIVVVIVSTGYLAHLRFTDSSLDEDISAETYWGIHQRIDRIVRLKCSRRRSRQFPNKYHS